MFGIGEIRRLVEVVFVGRMRVFQIINMVTRLRPNNGMPPYIILLPQLVSLPICVE